MNQKEFEIGINRLISVFNRTDFDETAKAARKEGYDGFTTTLLESKHQPHELIRTIAKECADRHDTAFYYEDFRRGWKESVRISKELELYRQQYCGCVFSEMERYQGKLQKHSGTSGSTYDGKEILAQ